MVFPSGLPAIKSVYGDPLPYLNDKPIWEAMILETRPLRTPLPYAYADAMVTQVRAHKLVVDAIVQCLMTCVDLGVPLEYLRYGGCYCWRAMRGVDPLRLSTHAFGIAVDLDPMRNPMGSPGVLPPVVVDTFEGAGFTWGGRWQRPDPMHAQAASGY